MLLKSRSLISSGLPAALIAASLALSACGMEVETLETVRSALESPLGGYQMDDELPRFARDDLDARPLAVVVPAFDDVPRLGFPDLLAPVGAATGVLAGYWMDFAKGQGVLAGKWADANGRVLGHLKGVYGQSRLYGSEWVLFAKLIDRHGAARGIISGRQREGVFRGTWIVDPIDGREQLRGTLVGQADARGHFLGRWQSLERPQPVGLGEIPWHLLR